MTELAKNEDDRKVLAFVSADTGITRAIVTTPGRAAGAGRGAAPRLRRHHEGSGSSCAEAEKTGMDISPSAGEEAQQVADFIANTPPAVVARAKALLEN